MRPFECVFFCFFFFLPPDGQKFNLRQEIAKHYRVSSPNNNPWRGACWSEEGGGGGRLQNFLIFLKRKASTLPSHAIQQFALFHLTQASFAVIYLSKMSNAFDIFFLTIEIPLFAVTSKSNKTKYFQSFFFFSFFWIPYNGIWVKIIYLLVF